MIGNRVRLAGLPEPNRLPYSGWKSNHTRSVSAKQKDSEEAIGREFIC